MQIFGFKAGGYSYNKSFLNALLFSGVDELVVLDFHWVFGTLYFGSECIGKHCNTKNVALVWHRATSDLCVGLAYSSVPVSLCKQLKS